ncbi:MAG TPA: GAF domain-containing protein, partial [Anaerolineales bacterium]
GEVETPEWSGEGMVGNTAQSGQEILANHVSDEARYRYTGALPETQSEVTLPLKIEERVLGVLDVQSNLPGDFNESDLLVLHALAHNIASAIEGARLYSTERHRAEQLAVVGEISHAITSILDEEALLYEVVALIQKRFGYPYVHLFTVHPGRGKIFYEAGSGSRSELLKEQGYSYDLDDPAGIIPWVARHGEMVLANDVENEPRYRPSPLPPDNTRSELTVPLIFGGNVLGVLDVQSDQPEAFGEEDVFLFEALSDNVAVAMRNAYLYRSELWRRQAQDSLREVAGLLSANAGLDQVLDAILCELERSFPSDVAAIWLLEEEAPEAGSAQSPQLQLAAFHHAGPLGQDLQVGQDLDDILSSHHFTSEPGEIPSTTSWLTEALEADHPVIRKPQSPLDALGSSLGFLSTYSAIAAPLRTGEQSVGVLTLANRTPNRYGTEALAMTAAFANQAAVAIENTRLFEAAHEQAWVSTVLLQVADATQSLADLNELLVTVTRITPMLVGIRACALYLLDEGDAFVPAAASGLNHDQQVEFERWRFAPGDIPALDQLRTEKEPVILHGDVEGPNLFTILFAGLPSEELSETELLVLVPLMVRGELLGTFLIDYSNNLPGSANLEALEELFEEQLAILQGIAHQTAMAVENIRLLKAQKDEAYVSVALLQVAQAVVSSNDLDETLGSIVRITPILVGVKRSIIFLWDEARTAFQLTQAYGIHRSAEGKLYKPGEFPLLDAIRERDSLIAVPLGIEALAVSAPPDAWTQLSPPNQEQVDEYLGSEAGLLLAFPLSVKNKVLGVLLVQEPDAGLGGNTLGSQARRLREKRLEITTGITQQAALAIQNDRLQRETIERGRLEREMQLAREIQRAFLPHQLPQLAGWGLSVRWRTAREVGGDFYDIFVLPGRRIGLVIADVADKGMPAALFMTLTRTLVRATVQQVDSPGEVLKRVNDVLVPDAQQGMFVTIVYAVLSPDTGQLAYANAGHNPPLLFRGQSGEIERLEKGGMAIGVLEGNSIEERTITLGPGDYLIFYTDGVTEAFSPSGDMFGEASLRSAINAQAQAESAGETAIDAAQEMVDAIDDAVSDFLEDG